MPELSEWQSIETAPRDGTEFLALSTHEEMGGSFMQVVFWDTDNDPAFGWWIVDAQVARHVDAFTHWMPLPPLPSSHRGAE